jgi:hypothetical protein
MPTKLSREKLESFLLDIRDEPEWRTEANREMDYYDGNQLDSETLRLMAERGMAPLIRNLIGPTVDVVLGMEAKNKRDWKVIGDEESDIDTAMAMNKRLKDAERVSEADLACSDAYSSQIKVGIGWVEVARESNPFGSPYRVAHVHRREMFPDWRDTTRDMSRSRFLVRKQWHDEDILTLAFPGQKDKIKAAIYGDAAMPLWQNMQEAAETDIELAKELDGASRSSITSEEYRDFDRKRGALFEVWYKVYESGVVMRAPGGRVVEFDMENPNHQALAASGQIMLERAMLPRVRLSWWIGPHQLMDIPSPYPHNKFPYVPFWGYREDRTGVPYGLIRRMMSPQDEINSRLSKMMWLLSAKRVIADSDATIWSHDRIMQEIARPDAYVIMNENRKNKDASAFQVESDFQLSQQQFMVLQDASKAINDTAGVYQAMLGKQDQGGAESGVAINSLVEQGATTLAEVNDNYRYARRVVGEMLLSLVREDMRDDPQTVSVDFDGRRRDIHLNKPTVDDAGYVYRSNDIILAKMHVELEDVPNTPAYRAQQLQQLTEMTKSLPDDLKAIIFDLIVKTTDLETRHEIAERIARATGQKPSNMTPEEEEQWMQQQQEQQAVKQLGMQEMQAKVAKLEAEAEHKRAQADKTEAETDLLEDDTVRKTDEHLQNLGSRELENMRTLSEVDRNEAQAKAALQKPKESSAGTKSSKSKK